VNCARCQVEIPTSGLSAYLCELAENSTTSRVHGVVGKKRLLAGPGSEPMSVNGATTAYGLCTPVPSDGSTLLSYDLDPDMVRTGSLQLCFGGPPPQAANASVPGYWRDGLVPAVGSVVPPSQVFLPGVQAYDCFDTVVGLHDGTSGFSGESKEGEVEQETKSGDAVDRAVTFEVGHRLDHLLAHPLVHACYPWSRTCRGGGGYSPLPSPSAPLRTLSPAWWLAAPPLPKCGWLPWLCERTHAPLCCPSLLLLVLLVVWAHHCAAHAPF
jgi:hypothetical protein